VIAESSVTLVNIALTVQQLVDENKVVLDILLADLAEVRLHHVAHLNEELKHHRRVHVLLRDGREPDIGATNVKERRACNVCDRGTHLLARVDDIHSKCVHCIATFEENYNNLFFN